jgi:hypothetical protein
VRRSITVSLALLGFIASASVPAAAQTSTQAAAHADLTATWKINCPGVRNVLMTADAEQSQPLQVIAMLKCGEEVAFLDNAEGYTVQIKTAGGKIGYVAAMYIKGISAPKRATGAAGYKSSSAASASTASGYKSSSTASASAANYVTQNQHAALPLSFKQQK